MINEINHLGDFKMSNHKLNIEMLEMDRHYGKSDVYEKLYCVLTRLINGGNEEAGDAREEFEMAEQYSHDSTGELLGIIEEFGLQDAVYQHV